MQGFITGNSGWKLIMSILWICLGILLACLSGYVVYKSVQVSTPQGIPSFLVAQDTGKSKQIQSKTGDASMFIERSRRKTIQASGRVNIQNLKESRTQFGSATGALETFFISAICPPIPVEVYMYDAGFDSTEVCNIIEGGDEYGGGVPRVGGDVGCLDSDILPPSFDGGQPSSEHCQVFAGCPSVSCDTDIRLDAGCVSACIPAFDGGNPTTESPKL